MLHHPANELSTTNVQKKFTYYLIHSTRNSAAYPKFMSQCTLIINQLLYEMLQTNKRNEPQNSCQALISSSVSFQICVGTSVNKKFVNQPNTINKQRKVETYANPKVICFSSSTNIVEDKRPKSIAHSKGIPCVFKNLRAFFIRNSDTHIAQKRLTHQPFTHSAAKSNEDQRK